MELETWKNYRAHLRDLTRRIGRFRLDDIDQGVVVDFSSRVVTPRVLRMRYARRVGDLSPNFPPIVLTGLHSIGPYATDFARSSGV